MALSFLAPTIYLRPHARFVLDGRFLTPLLDALGSSHLLAERAFRAPALSMSPSLQPLRETDLDEIAGAFQALGWNKPRLQYETYLGEQAAGYRSVFVCRVEGVFAGYVTIVWDSRYPPFEMENIPEIVDLNVLPEFRQRGLGERLVRECERLAEARGHQKIGLGVGLLADYGSAQRLYFRLGFMPDGRGLYSGNRAVHYGEAVTANDDLALFLSKKLR